MVELRPLNQRDKVEAYFKGNGINFNENSGCVIAVCGSKVIGFCLYDLEKDKIIIKFIEPKDDLPLLDGVLRSTLHVAAEKSIMNAFYEGEENEKIFEKIGFIKDIEEKTLNIDKLFGGCNCH